MTVQLRPGFTRRIRFNAYALGFLTCYLFFWWPWLLPVDPAPWLIPFCTFVALPLLDAIVGEYRGNWQTSETSWVRARWWPRVLPALAIVVFTVYQYQVGALFAATDSTLAQIGWVLTAGIAGGVMAINVGHELIHRKTLWEQRLGSILLASVGYGTFKVEHIYGHHTWVATPNDMTTAPVNMTIYQFWFRALTKTPRRAWGIAQKRAEKRNHKLNEVWRLTLISLGFLLTYSLLFGIAGSLFWLAHSLVAILLLETVNYLEHYGLERRETAPGKYEKITPRHSWNSSRLLTNFVLFNLQRHSDHHAHAARTYVELRHFEEAPQLPQGYAAMILLALFPPLWFRVMNARLPTDQDSA